MIQKGFGDKQTHGQVSQITNVLYKMGSELQSVATVMPYKKGEMIESVVHVLGEFGACALWLSDGEITQEVIVLNHREGRVNIMFVS